MAIEPRNVAAVARDAGIKQQTLDGYVHGRMPNGPNAVAIAKALGVNVEWLMTGQGPRHAGPDIVDENAEVRLPLYDLFAFEGPSFPKALETVTQRRERVLAVARTLDGVWIAEMPNDAMPNIAAPGDFILVRPTGGRLQDRKVYVFLFDGRPMVRRVELRPSGLALVAENPEIEPIVLNDETESLLIPLGQVVGVTMSRAV